MKYEVYNIDPVTKPRMTQRDKWKKRPCVVKYNSFKDHVKTSKIEVPSSGSHIIFVKKMPLSWSKKKKERYLNNEHQQKNDIDNLLKALYDAIFDEDQHIWDCRATKVWGYHGRIIIISGIRTDWIKEFLNENL